MADDWGVADTGVRTNAMPNLPGVYCEACKHIGRDLFTITFPALDESIILCEECGARLLAHLRDEPDKPMLQ
jgi:hypothetical protein